MISQEVSSKLTVPGPGAYNIHIKPRSGTTNAKSGMGSSNRSSKVNNWVPGPG